MSYPWGLLPVALVLLVVLTWRLVRAFFADASFPERAVAAVVMAMAAVHVEVQVLGLLGVLSAGPLLGVLATATLVAVWVTRAVPAGEALRVEPTVWGLVAAVAAVLAVATLTARLLPIWQWDSVGYHLPFVNLVLQGHGFAGLPADLRYTNTYPHNIELEMVFVRALLPDDRLVDWAQVPQGLAGVVVTAALARRLGASQTLALVAGLAWVVAPAVFLQLPTNYVDVGTAVALLCAVYFLLLVRVRTRALVLGGIALGLFLGSKPSAPIATAALGLAAVVRALRSHHPRGAVALGVLTAAFGAEMYVVMLARHGNPIWPVALRLGPWTLPGDFTVNELLLSGAATPRAEGTLLQRLTVSWLAIDSPAAFDMRVGGFGVLFLMALPLALAGLVRRREVVASLAVAVTLLSPDPAVPRYVLGFGAVVFALALAELGRFERRRLVTGVALVVLGVGAAWQLGHAWPALVGDGPAWTEFWRMDDEERRGALGPDGSPEALVRAAGTLAAGEAVAFDEDFELPGLLWPPALENPVLLVPEQLSRQEQLRWLDEHRVRLLAIGPRHLGLVQATPSEWEAVTTCKSDPSTLYRRR